MAKIKQETIILNDYGSVKAFRRRRTSAKGKVKEWVTLEISAEPLIHMFDDSALGRGPAEAIRDALEKAIKNIGKTAVSATIARRNSARTALAGGNAPKSVLKRYTGGRIGTKPPKSGSVRLFNDSGRLAEGLSVRQNTKTSNLDFGPRLNVWTTNVPANRFTEGGGGHPPTQHLVKQLFDLVPMLKNPRRLMSDPAVKKAVVKSLDLLIIKAKNERDAKFKALRLAQMNAAKALIGAIRTLV